MLPHSKDAIVIPSADAEVLCRFANRLIGLLAETRSQLIAQDAMLRETAVDGDSAYWLQLNDQHLQSWDFHLTDIKLEQAIKRAALDSGFLALAGYAELTIESRDHRDIAASDLVEKCDAELKREEALREAERIRRRLEKRAAKLAKQKS
ncbi:hypothetical protein [Dyella subtropica]|uniref:hypothetical protein n=1 Tax=Dyella subtropica TaxID=2992127 RepID=UPI002255C48B|nr:hypothetical protein [Dyella subtropica]